MSWLFGSSKKKKEESVVYEGEDVSHITSFERDAVIYPPLPPFTPYAPSIAPYNAPVIHNSYQLSSSATTNPLDSIPFKISNKLENVSQVESSEIYTFRHFFRNVDKNLNTYESVYTFALERSVLQETNFLNGS